MIVTNEQLTLLRSRPHNTRLWLSIYQPTTVLAAQINDGSITKGDRSITFDTVTAGSYLLIQNGMTLNVGTTPGGFDKGTIRVRSATSTVLTVAENSHIDWSDGDYLTVVNFYEINPIYPRIISNPSDPTQTLWYKDYDTAYTNQNSILGSFVCMGPHHAGWSGDSVYYSASGTYNLLGDALTYQWTFEGADTTGSTAHTPGNITYSTPGHFTTRLVVTDSVNGAVDTSYRHVSVYNRPESGQNTPILNWELLGISGSRDQGGHTAKIRLHETISPSILKDGSLVVFFSDDWYAGQQVSVGGNAIGRSNILFVGYVLKGSIKYDYRSSTIDFDVGSPTEIMKQANGFAVSVQYSDNPATATSDPNIPSGWVAVLGMDVRRALYHYLRWHSTVLMTNDFEFIGTDRYIQYFDTDRTSLYDAIHTAMKGILTGNVVCDRQGKVWAERDIYVQPLAYPTTSPLTNVDWVNDIKLDEDRIPRTSFIEMGGIYFSGPGGTYAPLLSNAPGVAPNYRGAVERIQGLALLGQSELNTWVGRVYAQRNIIYPNVDINLAGNYRNFDIAPQEFIPLTVSESDTARGISFTNKNFYLNRMEWKYDPVTELLVPTVSLVEIATGVNGDTIDIPPIPDDNGYTTPTIQVPQIEVPAIPMTVISGGVGSNLPLWMPVMSSEVNGAETPPTVNWGLSSVLFGTGDTTFLSTATVASVPQIGPGSVRISACWYEAAAGYSLDCRIVAEAFKKTSGPVSVSIASVDKTNAQLIQGNGFDRSLPEVTLEWDDNVDFININCHLTNPVGAFTIAYLGLILRWSV